MHKIEIDDAVMLELQNRAVQGNLVFVPNRVLRVVLGIDGPNSETTGSMSVSTTPDAEKPRPPSPSGQLPTRARLTGRTLLKGHKDVPQHMRPYSDRGGTFYQFPVDFPVVLFDRGGYVIIPDADYMENNERIRVYQNTGKVVFPEGIKSLPGYIRCTHKHHD